MSNKKVPLSGGRSPEEVRKAHKEWKQKYPGKALKRQYKKTVVGKGTNTAKW